MRVATCLLVCVLAPALLHAAAGPRELDGAYRVMDSASALLPAKPDCALSFVAGVGLRSTAHIVTGRDVTLIVHEANHVTRRVHVDGQHPEALQPSALGHSIGWWDGDTLVVETVGLPGGRTVVERLRKVNQARALEVTVDGRVMLAERLPGSRHVEAVCGVADAQPSTDVVPSTVVASNRAAAVPPVLKPAFDGVWQIAQPVRSLRTAEGDVPPLRLDARRLHAERLELFKAGRAAEFNGSEDCVPPGELRSAHGGQPFEIVQGPGVIFIGYAWNRMLRLVYPQPAAVVAAGARSPSYYGSWTSRWDGNSLVLEGSGFRGDTILDATGLPGSDALHLTQRLTLAKSANELEIRTTVVDPKTYSHSWSTVQHYRRRPEGTIVEHICKPAKTAPENLTPATVQPGKP